jgi:molybdopterin-guanine dinucleotide biosynthesis protein A
VTTVVCPSIRESATLLSEIVDSYLTSLVTVDTHLLSVILLTGGSSRRMGGDKAGLEFGNDTLLTFHLKQIPREFPVVVVGEPIDNRLGVTCTREDPPGAGPVAAIASGMEAVTTPVVLVLAVDTPFALPQLLRLELGPESHALIPRDPSGKAQYLAGLYRSDSLRLALGRLGSPDNKSMRELTSHLQLIDYHELSPKDAQDFMDLDTPEDLATARELLASRPKVMP